MSGRFTFVLLYLVGQENETTHTNAQGYRYFDSKEESFEGVLLVWATIWSSHHENMSALGRFIQRMFHT